MLVVISYDPLYFCGVTCNFFFVSDFIDLSPFPFFLMSLAKGISNLLIFSKNQLLVSLVFSIVFFISVSFISALIFMILFFKINLFIYLFIYLWLCWVFVSVRGLSPVVASRGHSSSWCVGLAPSQPPLLQSTGSRCAGSVVVAHGLSRSVACGILPDQGSNPCPLHWQADS